MEFCIYINGVSTCTLPWFGSLAFMEQTIIEFPEISFDLQSSNIMMVEANNPNSQPDQYPDNNTMTITLGQAPDVMSPVSLALMLDQNPQEITWEVVNSTGDVLYSGGPYTQPNQFIVQQFNLPESDCYSFFIYDDGGDGLLGNGLYKLAYAGNNIFAEGKFFGYEDHTQFNIGLTDIARNSSMGGFDVYPNPANQQAHVAFSLNEPSEVHLAIFDGQGRMVHQSVKSYFASGYHHYSVDCNEFEAGVYFVRLITGETSQRKKLIVQ
jgi:hypothetical protein